VAAVAAIGTLGCALFLYLYLRERSNHAATREELAASNATKNQFCRIAYATVEDLLSSFDDPALSEDLLFGRAWGGLLFVGNAIQLCTGQPGGVGSTAIVFRDRRAVVADLERSAAALEPFR
jgi:hypothetical protein